MTQLRAATAGLVRLQEVVRRSRLAVGLMALPSRSFLEMSDAALALTGLHPSELASGDLAGTQTFAVVLLSPAHDPGAIADLLIGLDASQVGLDAVPGLQDLTGRQREILTRLLHGERVPTISRGMHLAASTVRNHLTMIYRKVGVHSQAELIERLHSPN